MKVFNTSPVIDYHCVLPADWDFLYELLKKRPPHANISHRKMPTKKEHYAFCKSKPYSVWWIITYKGKRAGSIYITKQNEIGIFISPRLYGKGIGTLAVEDMIRLNPRKQFLANIAPANTVSFEFFTKLGFRHVQNTLVREF